MSRIEVDGADAFRRTLHQVGEDAVNADVNRKAVDTLLERANPKTPRDSGALAASGHVEADETGGVVTYDEIYAGVIHNGWPDHNIDAQPWLAETALDQRDDLVEVYIDHISDLLHHVRGA